MIKLMTIKTVVIVSLLLMTDNQIIAQEKSLARFDLGSIYMLDDVETYSVCPENLTGEKGKGSMAIPDPDDPDLPFSKQAEHLGQGWKVRSFIKLKPGETVSIMDVEGPGIIQHIWMASSIVQDGFGRNAVLRFYWDNEENPSIEVPLTDFYAIGHGLVAPVSSLPVVVNGNSGMNCYWPMPFRKRARITLTNDDQEAGVDLFTYQITYAKTHVPEDAAYFHAQFRRVNQLPYKEVYTILDGVKGKGHYVGTYMCWGVNNNGWWEEGEIKFYLDGDKTFPTICGTGAEDYFCGSYNFHVRDPKTNKGDEYGYREFTTAYTGLPQVIRPDGQYRSQMRFGLYRWHIPYPIRFEKDMRVTIQALGWRTEGYLPLKDDIS